MQHRVVGGGDRLVARHQPRRDDPAEILGRQVVRRLAQRVDFGLHRGEAFGEVLGLVGQVLVHMPELRLHLLHQVDAALDHAEGHAGLQQDEAAADLGDVVVDRVGEHVPVGHPGVAALHAIGAGAFERHEMVVGGQLHAFARAVQHGHHALAVLALEHDREPRLGADVGHPGQRAAHPVAAFDAGGRELELLDAEQGLHRVREARAAQHLAGGDLRAQRLVQFGVVGVEDVPAERGLAPHAEAGGQAQLARAAHRVDGGAQVEGLVEARQVVAVGAGRAHRAHHPFGVEALGVDGAHQRRKLGLGDAAHRLKHRRAGGRGGAARGFDGREHSHGEMSGR